MMGRRNVKVGEGEEEEEVVVVESVRGERRAGRDDDA